MLIPELYPYLSLLLGTISVYLAWKQYNSRKTISQVSDFISIHDKVKICNSRDQVVARLAGIVGRAQSGDVVFGHCRFCTDYPLENFSLVPVAGKRGVTFQIVVDDRPETKDFLNYCLGLPSSYMNVRVAGNPIYASVFGIRGKEVLFCSHLLDRTIGVQIYDEVTTKYIELAFNVVWNESKKPKR